MTRPFLWYYKFSACDLDYDLSWLCRFCSFCGTSKAEHHLVIALSVCPLCCPVIWSCFWLSSQLNLHDYAYFYQTWHRCYTTREEWYARRGIISGLTVYIEMTFHSWDIYPFKFWPLTHFSSSHCDVHEGRLIESNITLREGLGNPIRVSKICSKSWTRGWDSRVPPSMWRFIIFLILVQKCAKYV